MELKVYIPITLELTDDYLTPLIRRVEESLGPEAEKIPASRGQIVRQAVLDGLVRDLDHLIAADGSVDLVCDPAGEFPLESDRQPLTVRQLAERLDKLTDSDKTPFSPKFSGKTPPTGQDRPEIL